MKTICPAIVIAMCLLVIGVGTATAQILSSPPNAHEQAAKTLEIEGIKLGISIDELKQARPKSTISETISSEKRQLVNFAISSSTRIENYRFMDNKLYALTVCYLDTTPDKSISQAIITKIMEPLGLPAESPTMQSGRMSWNWKFPAVDRQVSLSISRDAPHCEVYVCDPRQNDAAISRQLATPGISANEWIKSAYARVIDRYSELLTQVPEDVESLNSRGLAFFHSGEFKKAVADFNEAIRLSPLDPRLYYHRFLAHAALRNTNAAAADVTKAQEVDRGKCYLVFFMLPQYSAPRNADINTQLIWLLTQPAESELANAYLKERGDKANFALIAAFWDPAFSSDEVACQKVVRLLRMQKGLAQAELQNSLNECEKYSQRIQASWAAIQAGSGRFSAWDAYGVVRTYLDRVEKNLRLQ